MTPIIHLRSAKPKKYPKNKQKKNCKTTNQSHNHNIHYTKVREV